MLKVKFKSYPAAMVILGDEPTASKIGLVECEVCGQRTWLDDGSIEDVSKQIEFFIKQSECVMDTPKGAEAFRAAFLLKHPEAEITIRRT